jgi:heme/copper-type cytochrome/quinol oxidase subunit 2
MLTIAKKYFFAFSLLVLFLYSMLIFVSPCFSYSFKDVTEFYKQTAQETGVQQTDMASIVAMVINIILGLVGILFVVLFIYGGLRWMTSGGNEKQIESAKKILIYAVIGIVIVAGAYAISYFITSAIEQSTGAT